MPDKIKNKKYTLFSSRFFFSVLAILPYADCFFKPHSAASGKRTVKQKKGGKFPPDNKKRESSERTFPIARLFVKAGFYPITVAFAASAGISTSTALKSLQIMLTAVLLISIFASPASAPALAIA
jgi:hypothetical protein